MLDAYRQAVEAADQEDDVETEHQNTHPLSTGDAKRTLSDSPQRVGRPPFLLRGQPIGEYYQPELVALIRWLESDERIRTEDELVDEVARELGKRRGKNVVAAITAAIRQARR